MTASTIDFATERKRTTTRESFWSRIAAELCTAIELGVYAPGQRLPSESELARKFGVNRHTIRRSIASLCNQGLVRVLQGSGTYVETFAVDLVLGKRTRFRQSLALNGVRGRLWVSQSVVVRASAREVEMLRVAPRSFVLRLETLGESEGRPLHFAERIFPLPRFESLDRIVVETGSITTALASLGVADYTRADSRVSAQLPNATIAAHLQQAASQPVLHVESLNVDPEHTPIEYANTWFAGDRVTLTMRHNE